MPKIRFPVIGPKQAKYPKRALCPWCRKRKVWEPHSFATLSGAHHLHLTWHRAHWEGVGSHRDIYETVEIVREIEGQYEEYQLYWCSTRYLRASSMRASTSSRIACNGVGAACAQPSGGVSAEGTGEQLSLPLFGE